MVNTDVYLFKLYEESISEYSRRLYEELSGEFDNSYAIQVGIVFTFLSLLEKELESKNERITSQIEGEFDFIRASSVLDAINSLKAFIDRNSNLIWMEDLILTLSHLESNDLFNLLKKIFSELVIYNESAEVFDKYLDSVLTKGEGETSSSLGKLVRALLEKMGINTLYDATIGWGSLVYEVIKDYPQAMVLGQEINHGMLNYCRMLFVLTGRVSDRIDLKEGHVIRNPKHLGQLFDVIVCQPPFGMRNWGFNESLKEDERFLYGVPPRGIGDYAFISHVIASLSHDGKAVMILPPGALFRKGLEGAIREKLIKNNFIDTIIYLPIDYTFCEEQVSDINVVIFNKNKISNDILFIDGESLITKYLSYNGLSEEGIRELASIYHNREERLKVSKCFTLQEIEEKHYNLNVKRYFTELLVLEEFDINLLQEEYGMLKNRINLVQRELDEILGYDNMRKN